MANWYERTLLPKRIDAEMGVEELAEVRREVLKEASGIVLEIGVGSGHNLPFYAGISKLYALEPSKELLALAQTRAKSVAFPITFLHAGAEHIPLPDHCVDSIVSTWTLCSVRDVQRVLSELRRVLKPGGSFYFVEHGASPRSGIRAVQAVGTWVTKWFTGNCHYDRPIGALIEDAGFSFRTRDDGPEPGRPLIYNYQGIVTVK